MKRNTVNGACNENVSFMVHITKRLPVLVTTLDMVLTKQEAMAGATLIFLTSPGKITRQLLEEKVALKRAEGSAIRRCLGEDINYNECKFSGISFKQSLCITSWWLS